MGKRRAQLKFEVLPQPNDTTCGPTCLQAVYGYWDDEIHLDRVIEEVTPLDGGGTLAVWLACHALRRGYAAEIYTYNLQVFDPSWFAGGVDLAQKLCEQRKLKNDRKLRVATDAYLEYLSLGGRVEFEELTPALLRRFLNRQVPVLTGLSATYLYDCAREKDNKYNDTEGEPAGHFVVLSGYDRGKREVMVADPLHDNPRFKSRYYRVGMDRLIGAILLGIVTYDANLLIITPQDTPK